MRVFRAFLKKEWMEMIRTGKLYIIMILFFLFGIMNPALAKLTPWLMEQMAESGFVVTEMPVDALTSWTQFYKNIPMAMIVFVLIFAGILANEYQKGTLILTVSKGASKGAILLAKTTALLGIWTAGFVCCFGVTYGYTAVYWDNSIVKHCVYGGFLYWLFGVNVIAFLVLSAVLSNTVSMTLLGVAAYMAVQFLAGLVPKTGRFLPLKLTEGMALATGSSRPSDYLCALAVTSLTALVWFVLAQLFIKKKYL